METSPDGGGLFFGTGRMSWKNELMFNFSHFSPTGIYRASDREIFLTQLITLLIGNSRISAIDSTEDL